MTTLAPWPSTACNPLDRAARLLAATLLGLAPWVTTAAVWRGAASP